MAYILDSEHLTAKTVPELLGRFYPPFFSTGLQPHVKEFIAHAGQLVGQGVKLEYANRLSQAEAAADEEKAQLEDIEGQLEAANQEWAACATQPGRPFLAVIYLQGAAICAGAELSLTVMTLPPLLGMDPFSVLGILSSGSIVAALCVVKAVLVRLLEEPWQAVTQDALRSLVPHAPETPGKNIRGQFTVFILKKLDGIFTTRFVVLVLMNVFLLALLAGNLYMIGKLASVREEASRILSVLVEAESVADLSKLAIDRDIVREAILAVSLLVTFDGAVLLLWGMEEGRRSWRRRKADAQVKRLNALRQTQRTRWRQQQAEVEACRAAYQVAAEQALTTAALFQEQQEFLLQQAVARARAEQTAAEWAETCLCSSLTTLPH